MSFNEMDMFITNIHWQLKGFFLLLNSMGTIDFTRFTSIETINPERRNQFTFPF